jgi:RNA polymerase sigma-70 factor (ECF subfamily)
MESIPAMPADFNTLYVAALPAARRFARRLTTNQDDAEDLLQEASVRAWKAFPEWREIGSFQSWFLTILRNLSLNEHRKRKLLSLDAYLEAGTKEDFHAVLPVTDTDPLLGVMQQETQTTLRRFVAFLPSPFREMTQAYYLDDMDYEECRARFGVPMGTVKTRLRKGRILLRERHGSDPSVRLHAG